MANKYEIEADMVDMYCAFCGARPDGLHDVGCPYDVGCHSGGPRGATARSEKTPIDRQVGGNHYKDMAIQPVEFIEKNGLGFLEGCVIKRICRWQSKNGVEDLEKAKHEIDLLIELRGGEA